MHDDWDYYWSIESELEGSFAQTHLRDCKVEVLDSYAQVTALSPAFQATFPRQSQLVQQWGKLETNGGDVKLHDAREPGDQDLLDLAAVETLAHAGKVYAVEPDRVPSPSAGSAVAAVFRY